VIIHSIELKMTAGNYFDRVEKRIFTSADTFTIEISVIPEEGNRMSFIQIFPRDDARSRLQGLIEYMGRRLADEINSQEGMLLPMSSTPMEDEHKEPFFRERKL